MLKLHSQHYNLQDMLTHMLMDMNMLRDMNIMENKKRSMIMKRRKRRRNNHNNNNNQNKQRRKKSQLLKMMKINQRRQYVNLMHYPHQHSILMIGRENSWHPKIMLLNYNVSGLFLIAKVGPFGLLNISRLMVKERYCFHSEITAVVSCKDVIHTLRDGLSLFMEFMEMSPILKLVVLGFGEELESHNTWYLNV